METAKDITPSNRDKELWSAASIILELFNAQQEYTEQDWHDWLKEFTEKREKEIADKAWEASVDTAIAKFEEARRNATKLQDLVFLDVVLAVLEGLKSGSNRSTFMKELFLE